MKVRIRKVQGGYRIDEAVGGGLYITWEGLFSTKEGAQKEINLERRLRSDKR